MLSACYTYVCILYAQICHMTVTWHNSHKMIITVKVVTWQSCQCDTSVTWHSTQSTYILTSLDCVPAGGGGGALRWGCLFCSFTSFFSFFLGLAEGGWTFEVEVAPSTVPVSGSVQRWKMEVVQTHDYVVQLARPSLLQGVLTPW